MIKYPVRCKKIDLHIIKRIINESLLLKIADIKS